MGYLNLLKEPIVWIFGAVCLGAVGQIFMKAGMNYLRASLGPITGLTYKIFYALLNPYVLSGIALYAVSALIWLMVLSRRELSYAYPMVSFAYVLVVSLSWLILGEQVSLWRIIGLGFICVGVAIVAKS